MATAVKGGGCQEVRQRKQQSRGNTVTKSAQHRSSISLLGKPPRDSLSSPLLLLDLQNAITASPKAM